jgi:predicted DNA-binding transcriptional regulator YafY
LDRIEGGVKTVGAPAAFDPPAAGVGVDDVVPAPDPDAAHAAEVLASDEVAWQVARRARGGGTAEPDGWTRFTVGLRDPDEFIFWALSFGPDLVVVEPRELRDLVVERLRALT